MCSVMPAVVHPMLPVPMPNLHSGIQPFQVVLWIRHMLSVSVTASVESHNLLRGVTKYEIKEVEQCSKGFLTLSGLGLCRAEAGSGRRL